MSRIRLLTVGKPRDVRMTGIADEYLKRLRAGMPVVWDTVSEEPFKKGDETRALGKEATRLLERMAPDDFVVILDVQGQSIDSETLAARLNEWRTAGKNIVFVVGGSLGLDEAVRVRAQWRWSLSPLTFPHGLAHVLVSEQLYRAWTILQGHPYHK